MTEIANYCVIEIHPNPERMEVVTVGLLIRARGKWDIRVLPDLNKLLALNPFFPANGIIQMAKTLKAMLFEFDSFDDVRFFLARIGGSPGLQRFVGQFSSCDENTYNEEINWLLSELVIPPKLPNELIVPSEAHNRLRTRLRKQFKNRNLLASRDEKIDDHKIVESFPISANQGLFAEFALKNSVMHITETVDFDVSQNSKRHKVLEAQAKTLILSAAKQHLGKDTKTYVVVAGSNRSIALPSINLLSDYADVFALESSADMEIYFEKIYIAAHAPQRVLKHT